MTMPAIAQEVVSPDEAAVVASFVKFIEEASAKRHPEGPVKRFNQGRAAGCAKAELTVPDTLPAEHRVGLFAAPRTYAAWIRFANAGSKTDREKDVRGMSIKVFDVPGENLTPGETCQDFVLNSHPVMVAPNTSEFLQAMKALDAGGFQQARYFLTHPRAALIGLRARQQPASHLDIAYWSTTPYLFGPGRAVKYHVRPVSGIVTSAPPNVTETYLTDALKKRLSQEDVVFELTVQFQTNATTMPIEDASVEWNERESPYVPLARIRIPKQAIDQGDTESRCESIAFNPWHALPAHRPLGNMNRARKEIYRAMAAFRSRRAGGAAGGQGAATR
jgi:hypothetical protein